MKVYLSADHAGFYLKEKVKEFFIQKGVLVEDFGANNFDSSDDYTDFVFPCIEKYLKDTGGDLSKGFCIVFGGSGTGEAIAVNRKKGARAVVYNGQSLDIVKVSRQHNNANVLSIGARFVEEARVFEAINIFQTTQFEAGRHISRNFKLDFNAY